MTPVPPFRPHRAAATTSLTTERTLMNPHALIAEIKERARKDALDQGIQSLGELMTSLRSMPQEALVTIGENGPSPSGLSSYRGYYERLGIETRRYDREYKTEVRGGGDGFDGSAFGLGWYEPGASGVEIAEPVTVAEFLNALELADGETFEGYKGGQFRMDRGTLMHVADHGDVGDMVIGAALIGDTAVIVTAEEDF